MRTGERLDDEEMKDEQKIDSVNECVNTDILNQNNQSNSIQNDNFLFPNQAFATINKKSQHHSGQKSNHISQNEKDT